MPENTTAMCHRRAQAVCFLIVLAATSTSRSAFGEKRLIIDDSFLTFDQLPAASSADDRIAAYAERLEWIAVSSDETPQVQGPSFDFVDVAVDVSSLVDPQDALAAAFNLAPTPATPELYEELGVALLIAARQARLGEEVERSHNHLRAARHVFSVADGGAFGGSVGRGGRDEMGLIHRAMLELEEVLSIATGDAWQDTANLLAGRLDSTSGGRSADSRILENPATDVGVGDVRFDQGYYIAGDVRAPTKIFAPTPRCTPAARRARIHGAIIIQIVIDRHGTVAALRLQGGLPMDVASDPLRTVAVWLFEPATLDGEPVNAIYNLAMRFRCEPERAQYRQLSRSRPVGADAAIRPSLLGTDIVF